MTGHILSITEREYTKVIDILYNDSNDGINAMLTSFVLLYADDIVILTENERDMPRNLDILNEYCICNKLKVNISKTNKMVFVRTTFKFVNTDFDQVEEYLYLGFC